MPSECRHCLLQFGVTENQTKPPLKCQSLERAARGRATLLQADLGTPGPDPARRQQTNLPVGSSRLWRLSVSKRSSSGGVGLQLNGVSKAMTRPSSALWPALSPTVQRSLPGLRTMHTHPSRLRQRLLLLECAEVGHGPRAERERGAMLTGSRGEWTIQVLASRQDRGSSRGRRTLLCRPMSKTEEWPDRRQSQS